MKKEYTASHDSSDSEVEHRSNNMCTNNYSPGSNNGAHGSIQGVGDQRHWSSRASAGWLTKKDLKEHHDCDHFLGEHACDNGLIFRGDTTESARAASIMEEEQQREYNQGRYSGWEHLEITAHGYDSEKDVYDDYDICAPEQRGDNRAWDNNGYRGPEPSGQREWNQGNWQREGNQGSWTGWEHPEVIAHDYHSEKDVNEDYDICTPEQRGGGRTTDYGGYNGYMEAGHTRGPVGYQGSNLGSNGYQGSNQGGSNASFNNRGSQAQHRGTGYQGSTQGTSQGSSQASSSHASSASVGTGRNITKYYGPFKGTGIGEEDRRTEHGVNSLGSLKDYEHIMSPMPAKAFARDILPFLSPDMFTPLQSSQAIQERVSTLAWARVEGPKPPRKKPGRQPCDPNEQVPLEISSPHVAPPSTNIQASTTNMDINWATRAVIPPFALNVVLYNTKLKTSVTETAHEDSGASRSFLPHSIAIKNRYDIVPSSWTIIDCNGGRTQSRGTVNIPVSYLGYHTVYPFEVIGTETGVIIGRDLMDAFELRQRPRIAAHIDAREDDLFMANTGSAEVKAPPRISRDEEEQISDTDKDGLSSSDRVKKAAQMGHIRKALDRNQAEVTENSFCTLDEAVVHVNHEVGTLPSFRRQYPQAQVIERLLDKHVSIWLERGYCHPWEPTIDHPRQLWNSPLLGVPSAWDNRRQVTEVRPCMDLKGVNMHLTDVDIFPMTNIRQMLSAVAGAKLFTKLDLRKALNQMLLDTDSKHKLSFMWRDKSYTFTRGPFGLKFLSSQFQRLMQAVFKDMPFAYCYIDDIWIVSGEDFALHMSYVKQALDRLTEVRLRVNAEKCEFFLRTFIGLGHKITPSGIEVDPRKVESIMKVPLPESFADLSGFMGLANQLHEHVRHYAELASPLFNLMTSEGRKVDGKPSRTRRPPWTPELVKNFKTLQHAIAHAPALTSPNFDVCAQPFSINVDASTFGHGSVIWQPKLLGETMNASNIISFRSHSLKKYELRYAGSPYKLELLALVTALTDYHDYIWGRSITVYTDHRALTYIHEQKGLNRHLALWMDTILNYTFNIIHIPGTRNGLADALSRLYPNLWGIPCTGSLEASLNTISLQLREITEEHREIIQRFHSRGHFGMQSILRNIRHHDLEWIGVIEDIRELIQCCEVCQRWNLGIRYFHEMRSNQMDQPWTHIQFDLITSFDITPDGYAYCLVVVCMFSGFTVLLALRTKTALEHIRRLWKLFSVIGLPKIIQSDNEPTFVSILMKGFYDRLKALHITITPYNHRALGKAESSVKTVSNCTHKLLSQCGGTWKELMPSANLSLNIHIAELNGVSAFNLMFNRSPNLDDSDLVRIMPDIGASDQDRMKWIAHQKKVLSEIFPAVTARQVAKQICHYQRELWLCYLMNFVQARMNRLMLVLTELRAGILGVLMT